MYKTVTGIAERTRRKPAFASVSAGLVFQTSLKNRGKLPNAENRSFKLTSAIQYDTQYSARNMFAANQFNNFMKQVMRLLVYLQHECLKKFKLFQTLIPFFL